MVKKHCVLSPADLQVVLQANAPAAKEAKRKWLQLRNLLRGAIVQPEKNELGTFKEYDLLASP